MPTPENDAQAGCRASGPLRVAALAKQVPVGESLSLRSDGRLDRGSSPLEMNPYCRRAVSKGTELAKASGGTCTVFTMGPPEAEDVLREAVAWGATEGVHLCDPMFGGSDTLATAQTLVAALRRCGTFDLVLVGRSTVDGDTGQVGPEIAELLDLPFAAGVRRLELDGELLRLELEQDDGHAEVELALPAVLSVAERLCEPCKADPAGRAAVPDDRLCRITADDLGDGPWGEAASPTRVGDVRTMIHVREGRRLSGPVRAQVEHAVTLLAGRGALGFAGGLPGRADRSRGRDASRRSINGGTGPAGGAGPGSGGNGPCSSARGCRSRRGRGARAGPPAGGRRTGGRGGADWPRRSGVSSRSIATRG